MTKRIRYFLDYKILLINYSKKVIKIFNVRIFFNIFYLYLSYIIKKIGFNLKKIKLEHKLESRCINY